MTAFFTSSRPGVRRLLFGVLLASAAGIVWTAALAQQRTSERAAPRERGQPARQGDVALTVRTGLIPRGKVTFTAEREAAALTFVRQHRPELTEVLENLKVRQPAEYQRSVCDLFWTSEMLAAVRQEDAQRFEYALTSWKLESLANLQAAQLAGAPEGGERLKAELEKSVEQLVGAQIEESAYAVRRQEAQLRRAQDRQKRLESRREELVRERLGTILKAIESTEPVSNRNEE